MSAPPPPSRLDVFFTNNQTPILAGAFATQVCHHQYIKRSEPAIASTISSSRAAFLPRPLKAGLAWGVVFVGLLTQITLAKQAVRDHKDPVLTQALRKQSWKRTTEEKA
ncbi:hypothetical protein BJ875DRAFT_492940 [Amylocarpus encephaloides]|uniref:Uncharacterized protein n=1 Tax=Amylocarpus encephaloides TaxID=45428 RepID=A0A9P8C8K3_9HELO|nr:hypothetical protein BJ875DRAFT_492940 [Amylocarpus encephaloides]